MATKIHNQGKDLIGTQIVDVIFLKWIRTVASHQKLRLKPLTQLVKVFVIWANYQV